MVLMKTLGHHGKSLILTLVKERQNVAWVYIILVIIFICLLTEKKSVYLKIKNDTKNFNFLTQFCLVSMSNRFGVTVSREVSLKENVNVTY